MSNHYSDFEELRPTGEASHIPDETLNGRYDNESRQQRVATTTGGYPDEPSDAGAECQSCGASIPAGQTKCRFCLTNRLGNEAASTDDTADTTFLGIVHLVVESTTFYGAVAKGSAAANLLAANDTERAIDDCTLIYHLNDEPAPQLRDRWPTLPTAVEVASADGEQLLAAARDRMGRSVQPKSESHQEAVACLYDESGAPLRDESHLMTVLDDAGDQAWLVPAIALTKTPSEHQSASQRTSVPTKEQLECQSCGRTTDHQFRSYESIPSETWTGQPIWECQVCESSRYGPNPK